MDADMKSDCIVPVEGDEVKVKVEFEEPGRELGNTEVLEMTW